MLPMHGAGRGSLLGRDVDLLKCFLDELLFLEVLEKDSEVF